MVWKAAIPGGSGGYGCVSVRYKGSVYSSINSDYSYNYREVTGGFSTLGVISADGTQAYVTQTHCNADNTAPSMITLGSGGAQFMGRVSPYVTTCISGVVTEISPCDGF